MQQKIKVQPYAVFRSKKDFDTCVAGLISEYVAEYMKPHRRDAYNKGIDAGTTYGLDMALLALGRMVNDGGAEHKIDISDQNFLIEFMKNVGEAAADYGELFDIDLEENHDKDYWWSGSKLDQELFSYIPKEIYPSFEERYKKK